MRKIVLTFGLIAGAILSAMMLITIPFHDQIGFDRGLIIGYTTMVIAFLMVFVGVKSYRDNVAGGHVTFGRAFKVGLLITVVASVCYVATWQVVYHKLAPDYLEKYSAYALVGSVRRHGSAARREEAGDGGVRGDVQKSAREHRVYPARAVAGRTPVHARDGVGTEPDAAERGTSRRVG